MDCHNILIEGKGLFDGQGYDWWWYVILTTIDNRPVILNMNQCTNVLIRQLHFFNSPMYHLFLHDMLDLIVRDIEIEVDVDAQRKLLTSFGYLLISLFIFLIIPNRHMRDDIPTFPLNTDGIDPAGKNILIENIRHLYILFVFLNL